MLSEPTLRRIKERDGVVGLIFAKHQMEDGDPLERRLRLPAIRRETRFRRSFEILQAHIEEIHRVMGGSHRHTAIGSDLDGFIHPTLSGLQDMRSMKWLADELRRHLRGRRRGDRVAQRAPPADHLLAGRPAGRVRVLAGLKTPRTLAEHETAVASEASAWGWRHSRRWR